MTSDGAEPMKVSLDSTWACAANFHNAAHQRFLTAQRAEMAANVRDLSRRLPFHASGPRGPLGQAHAGFQALPGIRAPPGLEAPPDLEAPASPLRQGPLGLLGPAPSEFAALVAARLLTMENQRLATQLQQLRALHPEASAVIPGTAQMDTTAEAAKARRPAATRRVASKESQSIFGAGSSECSTAVGSQETSAASSRSASVCRASEREGLQQPEVTRTTIMMRGIPNDFSRDMFVKLLDREGFAGCYNLVYLPMDFQAVQALGFAFVNLTAEHIAEDFFAHFDGFRDWGSESDKVCHAFWSDAAQGLAEHVEKFRNSPVMHKTVPDEFKPILLDNGERAPFPKATKRIKAPKLRSNIPTA